MFIHECLRHSFKRGNLLQALQGDPVEKRLYCPRCGSRRLKGHGNYG
ncbi:MAG: hypothetical protein KIH08_12350 [Candidatus Freyarchaeota archaeon]|nr:hypothetical protein [Candidatus Jordarchaeia archaeon]MBS7270084.1 hypothetical protein [Candidatus Jordarchaeia archaeon]MBS7280746.1 hypothetical protein [Candidatus Jordarchaeia archaeon]